MITHFITIEIELQKTPSQLLSQIEAELQKQGKLLRWAITSVNSERQLATVEAIVTSESAVSAT